MSNSQEPTPQKIGSYQVIKKLGAGGMGEVLLAYDDRLDRQVAVKRVRLQPGADASVDSQERFRREARAAAKLNHPSIVQIYDVLEDESGQNIVMEYVEGHTIATMLKNGPLHQDLVLSISQQVTEALTEAHDNGIIHRDLKSENVVVTPKGVAKILDFGLARQLESEDESLTGSGQMLGTLRSMAPEQARGEKVDARTDLFSLGVMLYEMLTANSPFRGENFLQTLHNVQNVNPPSLLELNQNLDPALVQLVDWLLQKEPDKRPFNARQTVQILQRVRASRGEAAKPGVSQGDILKELREQPLQYNPSTGETEAAPSGVTITSKSNAPTMDAHHLTQTQKKASRSGFIGGLLAATAVLLGVFIWYEWFRVVEPLRVVILRPTLDGEGEGAKIMELGVFEATLSTLTTLQQLSPIHPNQIDKSEANPTEIARAVGADELFSADIIYDEGFSQVTLRRVSGADGAILWSDSFEVPGRIEEALITAEALATRIRRAYPRHPLRPGSPKLEVRDQDYAELLKITQRFKSAEYTFETEIERLDAILKGSPRFLGAYLLAGTNALVHYGNSGDHQFLQKAAEYRDRALVLAPRDLRCLNLHFRVSLARGRTDDAEAALMELDQLEPRSIPTLISRSKLAEKKGDLNRAIGFMKDAVGRRPQWRSLYRLSKLEIQAGQVDSAKAHLEKLLLIAPGNTWGMVGLANAEMLYGDLARAESLFLELSRLIPRRSFFANLGTTRFLRRDYENAAKAYAKAGELAPTDAHILLGLADCYMAMNSADQALPLYGKVLDILQEREKSVSLKPIDTLVKAQCLAYSGEMDQAVELAFKTLQDNPDHAEIAFQAALIYALAQETRSVLASAKTALDKGIQPRWFSSPAFDAIREDPRFRKLMVSEKNE